VIDPKQFADRVAALEARLNEKLGVRGKTLQRRIDKAGRHLPKRLRAEAKVVLLSLIHISEPTRPY